MQSHHVAQYPVVVAEINQYIDQIVELVRVLPPDKLLHRAWWGNAMSSLHIKAEVDIGPEGAIAMRMIDYIQSIIASTIPSATQKNEVSDQDWHELCKSVEALFRKLNGQFHICSTAKRKIEDDNYNENLEEFLFKSQIYWCNVRGHRYQVHQLDALDELIIPQSTVIKEVFEISGEKISEELGKVWNSLTFGIEEMGNFKRASLDAMKADIQAGLVDPNLGPSEIMADTLKRHGLNQDADSAFGKLFGMDLFDLQKLTNLPESFLEEFSWAPGQDTEFFSEGSFKGWPLKIWPTFKRPFIKIDGRYYCFDMYSLFDYFYRQIEKKVFAHSEPVKQQWVKIRKDISEAMPLKYLQKILPSSLLIKEAFYQWNTGSGGQKQWCEADALIAYDDHLFVIEVKAGSFTYTSPADDLPAYIESLKNLVQSPAQQGQRFLDYLGSADQVSIYDRDHNEVYQVRKKDYRNVTLCAVTQDPFTEIAAQIQHVHRIGVHIGNAPVWSLSIDDLQVYADIFKSPLEFLHYVEQRMRAFDSQVLKLDDELDHLGLYLKHNNYSQYAGEMVGKSTAHLNFLGYRSDIDGYFHDKLQGSETSIQLFQEMPFRLREIINYLSDINKPGRSRVASYLLDIDGDSRKRISNDLETELKNIVIPNRIRPFSTHGDVRLTIFPWNIPLALRKEADAVDYTKALIILNEERDRLLIEPTYNGAKELIYLDWRFIQTQDISAEELERLKEMAESIREKRIIKAKVEFGKIGRNTPCPCGSGKKYKRCCS